MRHWTPILTFILYFIVAFPFCLWSLYLRILISSPRIDIVTISVFVLFMPYLALSLFLIGKMRSPSLGSKLRAIVALLGVVGGLASLVFLVVFVDQTNAYFDPSRNISSSGMGWGTTTARQFVSIWLSSYLAGFVMLTLGYIAKSRTAETQNTNPEDHAE